MEEIIFDFPVSIPQGTEYDLLGVGPEATSDEITDANDVLVRKLLADRAKAMRKLETVYDAVPELRSVEQRVEGLRAGEETEDPEELGTQLKELARLERRAMGIDSGFREHREKAAELHRQIEALNSGSLQNSEERREYDRRHPPFELLKFPASTLDEFATDRRVALALIRRELIRFFAQHGEEVFHPSDLTQEDFSRDFVRNRMLDGSGP